MNCKPGDLAYIVRSDAAQSNIGAVVEVIEISPWMTRYWGEPVWEVHSARLLTTLSGEVTAGHGHAKDAYLRPISGVPVHDEQRDEVTA